jgi:hypothetical protein
VNEDAGIAVILAGEQGPSNLLEVTRKCDYGPSLASIQSPLVGVSGASSMGVL